LKVLSCQLGLLFLHRSLLGFDEHLYIVLIKIKFEVLANIINEYTYDIPMAQVFDIFLQNIPFQTFKCKPNLLMEHSSLEVVIVAILLRNVALRDLLEQLLGIQQRVPWPNE